MEISSISLKRNFRFENVENGDFIKFKMIKNNLESDEKFKNKYAIYMGKIIDASIIGYLGVLIDCNDKKLDYPIDSKIYIDRRSVLQIYPAKYVQYITPRLALKHLWKDFIFREVKTSKCNSLLYVEYRYISNTGFERIKKFSSLKDAYANVPLEYHKNIVAYYDDYFGFTTSKSLRDNDSYYDKEIFFSKKCYCELDWSSSPTGDFRHEKGTNLIPPDPNSLICGIVENGEKGLFFRKWFVCSKEFLTLWTMVCAPKDPSLSKQSPVINEDVSKWMKKEKIWMKRDKNDKPKKKIKDFDTLLAELDTSCYSVDMKLSLAEKRRKFKVYNLEKCALYFPTRYKQIAQVLFYRDFDDEKSGNSEDLLGEQTDFQRKLLRNILWSKRVM